MHNCLPRQMSLEMLALSGDKGPWWSVMLLALGIAAFVMFGPLGCGDEQPEEPGVLSIGWRVSPLGCEASALTTIDVQVRGLEGQPGTTRTLPCESGRAILDDLEPGPYSFRLLGHDDAGQATFQSEESRVAIKSGRVTTMNAVRLTAKTGSMTVTWFFDNGHLCASNGAQYVIVGVYDKDAYAIAEEVFECDQGTGHIEGLQSGSFLVEVIGLAPDMTSLFRGIEEIELERGDEIKLDVALDTCGEGC